MLKCGVVISTFIIVSLTGEPGHGSREKRTTNYHWPPKNSQSKAHLKFNTHIGNRQVRQAEQPVSNWHNQYYKNGIQSAESVTSTNNPPNNKNNNFQNQNYNVYLYSEGTGMRFFNDNVRPEYDSSQSPPNEGNPIKNQEYQNRSGYDNILYDKQLENDNKKAHDRPSSPTVQFNDRKQDDRQDETSYYHGESYYSSHNPYDYDRYNRGHPPPPPPPHDPWGPPHHYHWGPPPPPPQHHHHWGPPPSPPNHHHWGPPPPPPPPPDHYQSPRDRHRPPPPRGPPQDYRPPPHYGRPPPTPDHHHPPPPPDNSWPPRNDHRRPPPHDYRGPPPHGGYGPPPREDREPPSRHHRGPPPHDNYGPPPHGGYGPPPREDREPPPRHDRGPPPHDNYGPPSRDHHGPPPHEDRGPPPRNHDEPPLRDHAYNKEQQDHLQNNEKAQIIISILNDANSNRPSISTNKSDVVEQVTRENESKSVTNAQIKREETKENWQIDERFAKDDQTPATSTAKESQIPSFYQAMPRRTPQAWDDESRNFHESAELRGPPSTYSRSDHWGRRGPSSNRGSPQNQGPSSEYRDPSDNRALLSVPLLSISLLPNNSPPGLNNPSGNDNYGPPGLNKPSGSYYNGPPGHNKPNGNGNNGPPGHNKPHGNYNNGPPGHNKPNGNGNKGPPGHNKPNGNGNKGPPGHNKPPGNYNNGPSGQNNPSGNHPQTNYELDQNNNGYPPAAVTNTPNPWTTPNYSHNTGITNYITDKFSEGTPIPADMMFQAIAVTPEE